AAEQVKVAIQQFDASPLCIQRTNLSASGNGLSGVGQSVIVAIRPEQIELWVKAPEGKPNMVPANLQSVQFLGDRYEYTVALGSETRVLVSPASRHLKAGEKIYLELKSEGITLWPKEACPSPLIQFTPLLVGLPRHFGHPVDLPFLSSGFLFFRAPAMRLTTLLW